jgi:hypothetical protein
MKSIDKNISCLQMTIQKDRSKEYYDKAIALEKRAGEATVDQAREIFAYAATKYRLLSDTILHRDEECLATISSSGEESLDDEAH